MKKIVYAALTCILLTATGCQGLDEVTYSSYQEKTFYQNQTQLEAATLSAYAVMGNAGSWERWLHAIGTTQCKYALSPNQVFYPYIHHSVDGSYPEFNSLWNDYYDAINRSNDVIANAHKANIPEDIINQYVGEARFLRAFCYYQLAVLWGDVPLHLTPTTPETISLPRTPVADVMEAVQEDLAFAIAHLPLQWPSKGRATRKSAIFLMGKVMLQMAGKPLYRSGMHQMIVDTMKNMMWNPAAYGAGLEASYQNVFSNSNKNNKEVLLTWSSGRDSHGSQMPYLLLPVNCNLFSVGTTNNASGIIGLAQTLYNLFEINDDRRALLLYTYTQKGTTTPTVYGGGTYQASRGRGIGIGKYTDPQSLGNSSSVNDKIVYRFSEAYLIFAEAYNELGRPDSAAYYLNQVRIRAHATPVPVGSQADLRAAIRKERYLELYGEWGEIFDIRRLDEGAEQWRDQQCILLYYNVLNPGNPKDQSKYDSKWDLFPLPNRELDANTAITYNNPGW